MNSEADHIRDAAPGLGITLTVALIAYLVSSLHPSFDALVISVIFGMLVANMLDDRALIQSGIGLALRIFLPIGIALYGLQLRVTALEAQLLAGAFAVFAAMFAVCYFICRGVGLERPLSVLLSTGMSVCGTPAIVVMASVLVAKNEDTSLSMIAVITAGLVGMIIYSTVPDMMGMDAEKFAFLSGTTLPMLGQVKVAASAMGGESLNMALRYKLAKMSALALVAVVGILALGRRNGSFRLPWFMAVFFAFAVLVNVSGLAAAFGEAARSASGVFLSIALAAVGLSINIDSVADRGWGPLVSVLLAWAIIVLTVYLALNVIPWLPW
jgi:uncharacterized integral membrane protein (TIGR00698 family)